MSKLSHNFNNDTCTNCNAKKYSSEYVYRDGCPTIGIKFEKSGAIKFDLDTYLKSPAGRDQLNRISKFRRTYE